jgi:GNAT superfamily N-acetyltransferase
MKSSSNIIYTAQEHELDRCWLLVRGLRPHVSQLEFVKAISEMRHEGYTPVFIKEGEAVVSYAGYREMQMLFCGKIIYIDDLVTAPDYRGKGFASILLEYIIQIARQKKLSGVHLDSGYLKNEAHRLYLNKGFLLKAHHFALDL